MKFDAYFSRGVEHFWFYFLEIIDQYCDFFLKIKKFKCKLYFNPKKLLLITPQPVSLQPANIFDGVLKMSLRAKSLQVGYCLSFLCAPLFQHDIPVPSSS